MSVDGHFCHTSGPAGSGTLIDMFTVHCPRHDGSVLLTVRNIEEIKNTPDGIEVAWRCYCGETGTLVTGRVPAAA